MDERQTADGELNGMHHPITDGELIDIENGIVDGQLIQFDDDTTDGASMDTSDRVTPSVGNGVQPDGADVHGEQLPTASFSDFVSDEVAPVPEEPHGTDDMVSSIETMVQEAERLLGDAEGQRSRLEDHRRLEEERAVVETEDQLNRLYSDVQGEIQDLRGRAWADAGRVRQQANSAWESAEAREAQLFERTKECEALIQRARNDRDKALQMRMEAEGIGLRAEEEADQLRLRAEEQADLVRKEARAEAKLLRNQITADAGSLIDEAREEEIAVRQRCAEMEAGARAKAQEAYARLVDDAQATSDGIIENADQRAKAIIEKAQAIQQDAVAMTEASLKTAEELAVGPAKAKAIEIVAQAKLDANTVLQEAAGIRSEAQNGLNRTVEQAKAVLADAHRVSKVAEAMLNQAKKTVERQSASGDGYPGARSARWGFAQQPMGTPDPGQFREYIDKRLESINARYHQQPKQETQPTEEPPAPVPAPARRNGFRHA